MSSSDKLTALVVGSGWGRHAARAFAQDPRVELRGIVGRGSPRTHRLAESFGVTSYSDLEEALTIVNPDIAMVAVHERSNVQLVSQCLRGHTHVLCAHPVAPRAEDVSELAQLAVKQGLIVGTDYSLRLTPEFLQIKEELSTLGPPLRISIECPGRALVIAIDLAVGLEGPVSRLCAAADYPLALVERAKAAPKAFPPSLMLVHETGCVTTIAPVPHAAPFCAHRVTISTERARLNAGFPAGGLSQLCYAGQGRVSERQLIAPAAPRVPEELFGSAMQVVATEYIDSVLADRSPSASWEQEAHIRALWAGASASSRTQQSVVIGHQEFGQ